MPVSVVVKRDSSNVIFYIIIGLLGFLCIIVLIGFGIGIYFFMKRRENVENTGSGRRLLSTSDIGSPILQSTSMPLNMPPIQAPVYYDVTAENVHEMPL